MLNFQELYDTYAADVFRFAVWISGDKYKAEDITSETFIRAWVKRSTIRTATLKAYLLTIARNLYLEKQRNHPKQVDLTQDIPDPAPRPEQVVETHQKLQEIRKILLALPEVDRTTFVMRVQQGLPYLEIARALGISLSAAKVKVHRVRKRLLVAILDQEVKI
jgi:RNA polymerase sigma-70 factor (ECF subfamily)